MSRIIIALLLAMPADALTLRVDWTGRVDRVFSPMAGLELGTEVGGFYEWDYDTPAFSLRNDRMAGSCASAPYDEVNFEYTCEGGPKIWSVPIYSESEDLGIFVYDGKTYWGLFSGTYHAGILEGQTYSFFSYTDSFRGAVDGSITSLQVSRTAIPEPSAALLFGMALAAMAIGRRMKRALVFCIVLAPLALPPSARALPVSTDWLEPGDGLLTSSGGLDWLDVSLTLGRSSAEVESDPDLDGFRYATLTEIIALAVDAGAVLTERNRTGDRGAALFAAYAPAALLLDRLGIPAYSGGPYGLFGLLDDGHLGMIFASTTVFALGDICLDCWRDEVHIAFLSNPEVNRARSGSPLFGHFLVAIPESDTALLVALGLVALSCRRRWN